MASTRNYIIAGIIAIALLALVFLIQKPTISVQTSNKSIVANKNSTANITGDARAILEEYNLSITESTGDKLVLQSYSNGCLVFIYPTTLEDAASSIKSEFNISIMEKNTSNEYIYIGEIIKPNNITLYKMLMYFKNESIAYVVLCGNLQVINQTYMNIAGELLKAYKEIIS